MRVLNASYLLSSPSVADCPPADRPEYAFIGRSNVGKSSLINMITGNSKLARTSNAPGKTQMINHFEVLSAPDKGEGKQSWYLVDLPGYGFAKISQRTRRKWQQMTENYFRQRTNLRQIFVLIDSRHTPQKADLEFVQQLMLWNTPPFNIVFTKSDKEKQAVVQKNVKFFMQSLLSFSQFLPRHLLTSAQKGTGRQQLLNLIEEFNQDVEDGN